MFSTVVLPLDDAPEGHRAILPGAAVAERFSTTVQVVNAIPELLGPHGPAAAEKLGGALDERGVAGTIDVLADDDQAGVITRWVAIQPEPIVVMATTSGGRARDVLLGSTAERLVHQLAAPILLVGPEVPADRRLNGRPVVIAIGADGPRPGTVALVRAWVDQDGVIPWVVTVVDPTTADDERSGASGAVARHAAEFGDDVQWEVLHGTDAAAAVADYADGLDAGSIVTTTHGRVGFERLVAGSTSFAVAHRARCPVLVHQPFTVVAHDLRVGSTPKGGS